MKLKYLFIFFLTFQWISYASLEDTEFSGFLEGAAGKPVASKEYQQEDFNLGEIRVQLQADTLLTDNSESRFKIDFYRDEVLEDWKLSLREGYISYYPSSFYEIKAGRQVLTWGTGDLIFINDRFPKDYESFYSGRDMEYLKVPSDAVKISFFPQKYIVDFVIIPLFTPNKVVNGEKLTFFDQSSGDFVYTGEDYLDADEPSTSLDNTQLAMRIKKNIEGNEIALYGYRGFYLDPNPSEDGEYYYSKTNVFGASWVGPAMRGIANSEIGYEDSRDDKNGDDLYITNSYLKFLLGYKREAGRDFTVGIQYYLEHMMDYDNYRESLPDSFSQYTRHKNRSMFALRLSKLVMQQKLKYELFTFYSPTDEDGYINPDILYKWTDDLSTSLGMNIFYGKDFHTDFAQLKDNTNIYLRIRYSF
ncbi:hypothetical protein [uncultured Ilyobacter sp.]|uniref:hypothetical protein n=1 Tax=uncultured Ilyobacter sp. TaxID=544433 RepID=UPI002AA8D5CF|nr:hypothetical protein [uncultured Ilyobacter sp.]